MQGDLFHHLATESRLLRIQSKKQERQKKLTITGNGRCFSRLIASFMTYRIQLWFAHKRVCWFRPLHECKKPTKNCNEIIKWTVSYVMDINWSVLNRRFRLPWRAIRSASITGMPLSLKLNGWQWKQISSLKFNSVATTMTNEMNRNCFHKENCEIYSTTLRFIKKFTFWLRCFSRRQ